MDSAIWPASISPPGMGQVSGIASLSKLGGDLSFIGSPDTFDYNDFLVRPGYEETFYSVVLDVLEDREWNELRLDSLIEHSPTLNYLPDLARQRGYSVEVEYEDVTSGVFLPDEMGWLTFPCSARKTVMSCAESCADWTRRRNGGGSPLPTRTK